ERVRSADVGAAIRVARARRARAGLDARPLEAGALVECEQTAELAHRTLTVVVAARVEAAAAVGRESAVLVGARRRLRGLRARFGAAAPARDAAAAADGGRGAVAALDHATASVRDRAAGICGALRLRERHARRAARSNDNSTAAHVR